MDDHTRGEAPGKEPGPDVPLKRDRKRLRSSPSRPTRADEPMAGTEPPPPATSDRFDGPAPSGLSPVEALFAAPPTAPLPERTPSASTTTAETDDRSLAQRLFGRNLGRRSAAADQPADADSVIEQQAPPVAYVPPGGFTGPGHPQLGPLAPRPVARHSGLLGLDIAAMATAVLLPPIGLVTAIIALIRGKRIRGWSSDLARAAVSVSLVMTVVFAAIGGYVWMSETEKAEQLAALKADQRAHALVESASEEFCGVLAAHPTIYSTADPDYGWPALDAPGGYHAAISAYAAVWAELAVVAPEGIAAETAAISERVAEVVSIANALGASNRAGDLLGLHSQTDLATVESWYVEYCGVPEIPAE